jgi:hypothetical protein
METFFLIPLVVAGLVLILAALRALFWYGRLALWHAQDSFNAFGERLRDRSDQAAYEFQTRARRRAFLRWLRAKIGGAGTGGSLDRDILETHRQTPVLRRLVEVELPAATLRCAKVHRLTALAAGAEFIREVAYEPECYSLRERVVNLGEAAVDMIGAYRFLLDDDNLLQNSIVLRKRIVPTCRDCPYLNYVAAAAPRLCPSAEAAGVRPEDADCDRDARKRRH